ncbi:unnamed protein product [Prorocentrum cordatum]|uniref:Uncharacterized protein n=1 Tax=Prorocentrum cordatum TaxID=2364126 RepID=A0ABN9URR4_9DINO|nr:unnamed protein product [Polarella glacialis]
MPLLQGDGGNHCYSNEKFHDAMVDFYQQYPGARNVVRVFKGLVKAYNISDIHGYQIEAMVNRVGKSKDNWTMRKDDESGRDLMEYMLIVLRAYPIHETRWSFVGFWLKSAKKLCIRKDNSPERKVDAALIKLQLVADELLAPQLTQAAGTGSPKLEDASSSKGLTSSFRESIQTFTPSEGLNFPS